MGKKNNKAYKPHTWEHNPNYKSNHYTPMYDSMIYSPAWLALSNSAQKQYIFIKSQYKGGYQQTDGNGNAMVKCPYKDMMKAGIKSNETISENCRQLEAFGFLPITGGGHRIASEYKFSNKWQNITGAEAKKIKAQLQADKQGREQKAKEKKRP